MSKRILIGTAVNIPTVQIVSPCGFNGRAGYSERVQDVKFGADAKISFITRHLSPLKIKTIEVNGREATVHQAVQSDYIPGMWNFYINFI